MKSRKCKDCQNWLSFDGNMCECDYDMFTPAKKEEALFFIPEQFDCDEWEKHK